MPKPLHAECLSACRGVAHGFFTRHGGVSKDVYASLNCGIGSRDEPAAVRENRRRVVTHFAAECLVSCCQVHGTSVVAVERAWSDFERPQCDAMVTAAQGRVLGVLTADCAPVLLADPVAGVIGAVHAGWRGALNGVLEAAITAMEGLGSKTERMRAAVGPCIGPSAYEVGWDFEREFLQRDTASAHFFTSSNPSSRPHFDLSGYVTHRLRRAGIVHPDQLAACTFTVDGDFFSYRRSQVRKEADYGRQISAIVLT
jgi:YfiH family protein